MQQTIQLKLLALSFLPIFLLQAGCSTMSVPELKTGRADSYLKHEEKAGLTIGTQALTDRRQIKDTFKINMLDKGLLPILLVAENQSASASFILAKDKVFVFSEANLTTNTYRAEKVTSETPGGAVAIAGASLIAATSLAGAQLLLAGLKMASDATVIQHNLADKELYSRTLGPGQKAQGFIYFQYPKENPPSGAYHVLVEVKDSSTGEPTTFDSRVDLTLPKP